jgi:hypothetical protein
MSERTRFLARLVGLYCVLAALMMAAQHAVLVATVTELTHDQPLLLVLGVVVVAAGLALVLTHNVWSGGALPVLVTVIGWATLAKGLLFWLLPAGQLAELYLVRLHYAQLYYLYCAFSLLLGLYLTAAGFRARPPAR